jgi:hypothetical protein
MGSIRKSGFDLARQWLCSRQKMGSIRKSGFDPENNGNLSPDREPRPDSRTNGRLPG